MSVWSTSTCVHGSKEGQYDPMVLMGAAKAVAHTGSTLGWTYINYAVDNSTGSIRYSLIFTLEGQASELKKCAKLASDFPRFVRESGGRDRHAAAAAWIPTMNPWEEWQVDFRIQDDDKPGIVRGLAEGLAMHNCCLGHLVGQVVRPERYPEFLVRGCVWCADDKAANSVETFIRSTPHRLRVVSVVRPLRNRSVG